MCVSASRTVNAGTERRMEGFSYVQGSGDDHELWGQVRYLLSLSNLLDDDDDVVYCWVIHIQTGYYRSDTL